MPSSPQVVVFDVNETLSDMAPMRERWQEVGAPADLTAQWFLEILRDGFALAAAGSSETFATLAEHTARRLLTAHVPDPAAAAAHLMAAFTELEVHPDVPDGVRRLSRTGARLVTLSNGASSVADQLLRRAGLRERFDALLSVEQAGRWKPAPESYRHAATTCQVQPERMMLVAVHPWDIDGAARAGLRTAFLNRDRATYPTYFRAPDVTVTSLPELVDVVRFPAA